MVALLLTSFLAVLQAVEVKQFQPTDKAAIPRALVESGTVCHEETSDQCWASFARMGDAWEGDVNDDGVAELLVFPGAPEWSGTGGLTHFLFEQREGDWVQIARWISLYGPVQILPPIRQGYHDLRTGADQCMKWTGSLYSPYELADYGALAPEWFDATELREAPMFWKIRYAGLNRIHFEPQWFPGQPNWSVNVELDDPVYNLRWLATFKGGVYGQRGEDVFLLLPRPAYRGAEKLTFEGEWLLIYGGKIEPLARYNRCTGELQLELQE
jgi:hypothetical protein